MNITTEQAKQLIRALLPHYNTQQITIHHIGEYTRSGSRHATAIGSIEFNQREQITVWNDSIRYWDGRKTAANGEATGDVFAAYRLLHQWGIVT